MSIPAEVVELAAKAMFSAPTGVKWELRDEAMKEEYRDEARAALEAAAPMLMHQAWVEGYRVGEVDCFLGEGGDQPAENKSPYHQERASG